MFLLLCVSFPWRFFVLRNCYIIDFIVHVSSLFLQFTLHWSCFIFVMVKMLTFLLRAWELYNTMPLAFLRQWHISMSREDTSQSIFSKMPSTLSTNSLSWTLSRILTTSRHPLLAYWAFAQHCLSIWTNLFDNNILACCQHFFQIQVF